MSSSSVRVDSALLLVAGFPDSEQEGNILGEMGLMCLRGSRGVTNMMLPGRCVMKQGHPEYRITLPRFSVILNDPGTRRQSP